MPVINQSPHQVQTESAEGIITAATPTWPTQTVISPMIMANPYDNKNERGKAFRQVLAAVVANLGKKKKNTMRLKYTMMLIDAFFFKFIILFFPFRSLGTINTGLVFGFSAVVLPQLRAKESEIQIGDQESWIGKSSISLLYSKNISTMNKQQQTVMGISFYKITQKKI